MIRARFVLLAVSVAVLGCGSSTVVQSVRFQDRCLELPPCGEVLGPPEETAEVEAVDPEVDRYAKRMVEGIQREWSVPGYARSGGKGHAKLRFGIQPDGGLVCLELLENTGPGHLSLAAMAAVCHSSPFEPLPDGYPPGEVEGVTITFFYNVRPPKDSVRVSFSGPFGYWYGFAKKGSQGTTQ